MLYKWFAARTWAGVGREGVSRLHAGHHHGQQGSQHDDQQGGAARDGAVSNGEGGAGVAVVGDAALQVVPVVQLGHPAERSDGGSHEVKLGLHGGPARVGCGWRGGGRCSLR